MKTPLPVVCQAGHQLVTDQYGTYCSRCGQGTLGDLADLADPDET